MHKEVMMFLSLRRIAVTVSLIILVAGLAAAAEIGPSPRATGDAVTTAFAPGPHSITQSTDTTTIVSGNSVSCNAGGLHADNSYVRRFVLDTDHGIVQQFDVTSVDFGVEEAVAAVGSAGQPVEVRLYSIPKASALTFANMTLIGSASNPTFPDQSLTVANMAVTGSILDPTTTDLVVEIFTPDGQTAGHSFFIGSNALGQSRPSYIAAAACGITDPMDLTAVGFPTMHIVMVVNGVELPVELMQLSVE